tara:strand:+ start:132 stop:281 length:150 start_codon:yes stop_codon:yes gene_type:complete
VSVLEKEGVLEDTYNSIVDELVADGMSLEDALIKATKLTMEKWLDDETG